MTKLRSISERERKFLTVLPAAAILAIYAIVYALPAQRSLQQQVRELQSVRKSAVTQSVADQARQSLKLAQTGLQQLNEEITDHRYQIQTLSQVWRDPESRLDTVRKVTELLQQFDLTIVNQDFQLDPQLSSYLQQVTDVIDQRSPDTPLEYWEIELEGGYWNVTDFLFELKSAGMKTFPVTLTMKASESGDGIHTWTILFLI